MNNIPNEKYSVCVDTGLIMCEIMAGLWVRQDGMIKRDYQYNYKTRKSQWMAGTYHNHFHGYERVDIKYYGKHYTISRLVATAFVDGCSDSLVVDHIDGNSLNNHFNNLRWVTHRENQMNRKRHREGRLVGVWFDCRNKRYRASCGINGTTKHIGYFDTEQEAHDAYTKFKHENGLI